MKQFLKLAFGIAVAAIFLTLLVAHLDFARVWIEIKNIRLNWLLLAFLSMILAVFTRGERWRQILLPLNQNVSAPTVWRIFAIGLGANAVLPFRIGDFMRGTAFAKVLSIPVGSLMTTVLIEKMCDLVFIVLLGGFALLSIPNSVHDKGVLHFGGTMILMVGISALGFLILARWFRRPVLHLAGIVFCKLPKISDIFLPIIGHVFDALDLLGKPKAMVKVLFWSFITWVFEWLTFICIALGMPALAKPMAALVAMPIATLSTALPGAPGAIGTFDFFTEEMMKILGNTRDSATAYAFLLHALILLTTTICALFALLSGKSLKNSAITGSI